MRQTKSFSFYIAYLIPSSVAQQDMEHALVLQMAESMSFGTQSFGHMPILSLLDDIH